MNRTRTFSVSLVLALLIVCPRLATPAAAAPPANRWEEAIRAFEAKDKQAPPPRHGILLIGSSSIRMWDEERYFPALPVIQRGFGGSEIADSVHFAPRIIFPYRPRTILLYAGDNDIARGKTPETVAQDYKRFVRIVHTVLPRTRIGFIAIKPSLARWKLVAKMRQANAAIHRLTAADERLFYVDIDKPMIGADGKPQRKYFIKDGLHLNDAGYKLWTSLVLPHIRSEKCLLTLELTDAKTGELLPGWVRMTAAGGEGLAPPELLSRGTGLPRNLPAWKWFALPHPAVLAVPRARITVEALSGLDTVLARAVIDATGKTSARLSIPLQRFAEPSLAGWISGNTHIHLMKLSRLQADRYLAEIPASDALDMAFVSYLERKDDDRTYVTNEYTAKDLAELSSATTRLVNGEEHRHNFGAYGEGFGHVMFLNNRRLVRPVSLGPGITGAGSDGQPLKAGILAAKAVGATVIWCHNRFGFEDIPSWLAGRVDAQNIFDGGAHGSFGETFYRYLNLGLRVPFSTGTDWFIYDFSRTYVRTGGSRDPGAWLRGLAAGRSFITNGPLLELSVGGRPIGAVLQVEGPETLDVTAVARGRVNFRRLELVQNGHVIAQADAAPVSLTAPAGAGQAFRARLDQSVTVDAPCWLAARTPPPPVSRPEAAGTVAKNEFGAPLFSHTSPVYVDCNGKRVLRRDVALELLEEINASVETIVEKARFVNEAERNAVLAVYKEARKQLRRHLKGSGESLKGM